jgi:hypothetical protein
MAVKIEIEVEIDENGEVQLTTHGIKGPTCERELEPILKNLGKVKASKRTKEFYERKAGIQGTQTTKTK